MIWLFSVYLFFSFQAHAFQESNAIAEVQKLFDSSILKKSEEAVASGKIPARAQIKVETPKKISFVSEVDDFSAIAVSSPYRDFPNVILFKREQTGVHVRVLEGLLLGIEGRPNSILDLHWIRVGVDLAVDNLKRDEFVLTTTESGSAVVHYGNFYHLHPVQDKSVTYFIDKAGYKEIATRIYDPRYSTVFPQTECTMFGVPALTKFQFTKQNGKYVVEVETSNQQRWKVSFDGVDAKNQFLLGKIIEAEKM